MVRPDCRVEPGAAQLLTPLVHEVVSVREWHRIRLPADTPHPNIPLEPSGLGVSVVLPERTASAVGWTLTTVVDLARVIAPETENFAIRIAQVE